MARLHAMIAEQIGDIADEDVQVVVGIETDRGPWVQALVAAGYTVLAVNPLQATRYRERRGLSGAKSDAADAHLLADMVRTDSHQLRPVAGDSAQAEAVKVVSRMHKTLIRERTRHMKKLLEDARRPRSCITRSFRAILPCRPAVVTPHPQLRGRSGRPSPGGARWHRLNPGQQALLVLVHLRKGETYAEVAAGFGVGVATAWRYITESVALLARRAPKLGQALRAAREAGHPYLVLDGTLIRIDRLAADRPYYSGKNKCHGMNIQVLASLAASCGPPDRWRTRCTT